VATGLQLAVSQDKAVGGGLGRPSSPRRRAYERLKPYATEQMQTLFRDEELERALDDMYQRPLLETAADLLNRLMRSGVNDDRAGRGREVLREEGRLTYTEDDAAVARAARGVLHGADRANNNMAKLDFPRLRKHLKAFDFPPPVRRRAGLEPPPPERDWQIDQVMAGHRLQPPHRGRAGGWWPCRWWCTADGGWPDEASA
jgi:hypothetical protein